MSYVPGRNVTFTIGNSNYYVTTVTASRDIGEVDVTNNRSNGNYEFITDIASTTFEFTTVQPMNGVIAIVPGTTATATMTVTNGRTVTGSATVLRATHTAGPRGAYTIAGTAKISGAVTES